MEHDRPLLGIILMLAFCLLIPLGDSLAKLLAPVIAVGMLVLIRFLFQALILLPVALMLGRPLHMGRRLFWLAYVRAILQLLGISCMFTALIYLPLADAVAIAFVMPFIMLLLGWAVLDESVGLRRLAACAVGFIGTLMVIQPNFLNVGWPVLYPLAVAVIFALYMLVTRLIAKDTDPIGLQAINGVMGTITLAPLLFIGTQLEIPALSFEWPPQETLWLAALMGLTGTIAHLLMTWSLRYAPSATLAPLQYLEIPIATVYGFVFFDEFPNGLAAFGICVTIGAGLYIIFRERAMSRQSSEAA